MASNKYRAASLSGLTNAEIAKRCGLHFSAVSRIRSGDRVPTYQTISKICAGLGFTDGIQADWVSAIVEGGAEGSRDFLSKILN